ncbi:MAG: SDR family oxidoreductase [candidate division WS1 bacterium]|jgi:NAD(P)-dependent dehydrogenase (short-subunit alcohol dehydrogenase family)|nr:SDR family oxidoreductase [candidate division WS1 bacterium]
MSIAGKSTVITGAAGNLGTAVVRHFVEAGATVAAVCHDEAETGRLSDALGGAKPALILTCDVTGEGQVQEVMRQVAEQLGGPQILLNLVGGYDAGVSVAEMDLSRWDHMLNMNLKSVFLCCKHALTYMIPADYGRIVNISSKVAQNLPARAAAYAVAKAGVASLTRCLAQELKGTGVSVTAVMPSVIDTPATRAARPNADFTRWVKPEQLAETLEMLSSEAARHLNGTVAPVFGGV